MRHGVGPVLAAVGAMVACAHGIESRKATFRDLPGSLTSCPAGQLASTVAEVTGREWAPGDRLTIRGHLAVVAWGPPCAAADEGTASGVKHCAVAWTLWDTATPPVEIDDDLPAGQIRLTADGSSVLPALADARDAKAAQAAAGDLDVTIFGALPERLCESENGYPEQAERTTKVDCAPLSLQIYPVSVTRICRNVK